MAVLLFLTYGKDILKTPGNRRKVAKIRNAQLMNGSVSTFWEKENAAVLNNALFVTMSNKYNNLRYIQTDRQRALL